MYYNVNRQNDKIICPSIFINYGGKNMRRKKSSRIAFCGISGGVILLLMLLGNIIPIATYTVPCLASILMMIVLEECGDTSAWTLYGAVSLLSMIVITDKELTLFYVLIMGFYPMLKKHIKKLRSSVFRLLIKLVAFNSALAVIYVILLVIFPIADTAAEFAALGRAMNIVLILLGNLVFFMLDAAMSKIRILYIKKLRPKLIKSIRS